VEILNRHEHRNFSQNSKFRSKISVEKQIGHKSIFFCKKCKCWSKIDFCKKCKCWSKIDFFVKTGNVGQIKNMLVKS